MKLSEQHGVPIAVLPADVDAANAGELASELVETVGNAAPGLVIDLSSTRYLDSAGIEMLFDIDRRLRRGRQSMRIALGADSPVRRVLRLTGVDDVIGIDDDVDAAVAACRAD